MPNLISIFIRISNAKTIDKMIPIITRNAEVKAFGSSAEYTEFLKWRQEQGRQ